MHRLFLLILLSLVALAAAPGEPYQIKFRVTDDGQNVLRGMTVKLYEGNTVVTEIDRAGSVVSLELNAQAYYTIEVELKGFVTKRIGVHTESLPENIKKGKFGFDVAMERMSDYSQYANPEDVLDYPKVILEFDTVSGGFKENETYFISTQQAFERLARSNREIKF